MVWAQHGLFSYSVPERHLECVQILVVIHGAARNFVYRFLLFEIPGKVCHEEVAKNLVNLISPMGVLWLLSQSL